MQYSGIVASIIRTTVFSNIDPLDDATCKLIALSIPSDSDIVQTSTSSSSIGLLSSPVSISSPHAPLVSNLSSECLPKHYISIA